MHMIQHKTTLSCFKCIGLSVVLCFSTERYGLKNVRLCILCRTIQMSPSWTYLECTIHTTLLCQTEGNCALSQMPMSCIQRLLYFTVQCNASLYTLGTTHTMWDGPLLGLNWNSSVSSPCHPLQLFLLQINGKGSEGFVIITFNFKLHIFHIQYETISVTQFEIFTPTHQIWVLAHTISWSSRAIQEGESMEMLHCCGVCNSPAWLSAT